MNQYPIVTPDRIDQATRSRSLLRRLMLVALVLAAFVAGVVTAEMTDLRETTRLDIDRRSA